MSSSLNNSIQIVQPHIDQIRQICKEELELKSRSNMIGIAIAVAVIILGVTLTIFSGGIGILPLIIVGTLVSASGWAFFTGLTLQRNRLQRFECTLKALDSPNFIQFASRKGIT